tara:strand:+ start:201 stop:788 length:588 start_codon:yes stop_codon:yes gene_type:complete
MKVVNLRNESADIYCGRKSSYRAKYGADCSALGNPFPTRGRSTRKECVEEYKQLVQENKEWFAEKLRVLVEYEKQLGRELTLGCFCAPKICHCDVLIHFVKHQLRFVPRPMAPKPVSTHPKTYDEEIYDALIDALRHQEDERGNVQQYGSKSDAVILVHTQMLDQHEGDMTVKEQRDLLGLIWATVANIETEDYR